MKKRSILLVCLIACVAFAVALAQEKPAPQADPKAEINLAAERGKALWNDASLGTNGKSCSACHTEPAELAGITHKFPKYQKMAKKVITIDQMVNMCIVNPRKGTALASDDQRMADIVTYMATMAPGKEMMPKEPKKEKEMKKTE
jgi:cytochrome c